MILLLSSSFSSLFFWMILIWSYYIFETYISIQKQVGLVPINKLFLSILLPGITASSPSLTHFPWVVFLLFSKQKWIECDRLHVYQLINYIHSHFNSFQYEGWIYIKKWISSQQFKLSIFVYMMNFESIFNDSLLNINRIYLSASQICSMKFCKFIQINHIFIRGLSCKIKHIKLFTGSMLTIDFFFILIYIEGDEPCHINLPYSVICIFNFDDSSFNNL